MNCSVYGCDAPSVKRTWCDRHYQVWRKYGDVEHPVKRCRSEPAKDRFWHYVVAGVNCCWIWTGGTNGPEGYGVFSVSGGRKVVAHRFAYEMLVGRISAGLTIDHLCCVKRCVNPAHMEPVTHRENNMRGNSATAVNFRKTHCIRGHEFTEDNIYHLGGGRQCKACWKIRQAKYDAQRKAKSA